MVVAGKNVSFGKVLGIFALEGGGPLFPKVNVKIVTKYQLFGENQKCSLWPKMQNKPSKNFNYYRGSQKEGGRVRHLGKFPKNTVFLEFTPKILKVFQDCVEVHMQHIQQGLRLVMIFMITKLVAKIEDDNDFDGNS